MRHDEEHKMQVAVFQWAAHHPELACMYAIPNGGNRDARTGARLKAEGVKAGMPDICLPVWTYAGGVGDDHAHGALYIEMKSRRGSVSDAQRAMHALLQDAGNVVRTCYSVESAITEICDYMGWPSPFKPTKGDTTK